MHQVSLPLDAGSSPVRNDSPKTRPSLSSQVGDIYGMLCAQEKLGMRSEVIAASFGKVIMVREGRAGLRFWLRYARALLRHYEEGFWLVVLVICSVVPGVKQLTRRVGQ